MEKLAEFYHRVMMFLTFIALISGCGKGSRQSDDNFALTRELPAESLTLVPTGTIEIPIDSVTLNYSHYPVYYANDTSEFYIYGNEIINSIDFYDLNRKELSRRNLYQKEGNDGILFTLIIYVKSLDSLYVYSADSKKIILTNYKGKIVDRYSVPEHWLANLLQPFTIIGDYAYFANMVPGDNRVQYGHRTIVKYNLKSGAYQEFGPYYPAIFRSHLYYNFLAYFTFGGKDNIVIRCGSLPAIYNYEISSDSTSEIEMRSRFQDAPIVPDTVAKEFREMDNSFEEIVQGVYGGVYYDKYNHVYYSIFKKGMPLQSSDGSFNDFEDKPTSILIFNENFEYSGEVALKEKTYFDNFICSKRGLLIPTSHSKNPNNDESILQFEMYRLQKK